MSESKPEEVVPLWKQLELLIADIQRQLAPGATITHNAKVKGHDSGIERQIDVLVQQSIGQFNMMIAIDCKDHSQPLDVNDIGAVQSMVKDIRANQGCVVCPRGFTAAAKRLAQTANIALYSVVDTADHKWRTPVALPAICEFRSASMAFGFSVSAPVPFRLPMDFWSVSRVVDADGNDMGTCLTAATDRWNDGEYPTDIGQHADVPIFPVPVRMDNGYGMLVPIDLTVQLHVTGRRFFGNLPLNAIRGLRDEQSGHVYTNAFTTGAVNPDEIEKAWQQLGEGEEPPTPPALVMTGLYLWEAGGL